MAKTIEISVTFWQISFTENSILCWIFALVDIFVLFILVVLGDDYQKTDLYGSQRFVLCFKFFSSPPHFQLMVLNLGRFVEPVFPAAFFV